MTNTVILIGRLTKEVEIRYTEKEMPIGNFTIAVNRQFKNTNGDYETDFINCVIFGEIAKSMSQYTTKGDLIGIKGRLQTRTYEDKENKKHYITEVIAERITYLQNKKKEEPKIIDGKTPIVVDTEQFELPF